MNEMYPEVRKMAEIKKEDFEKKLSGIRQEQKEKIMLAYRLAERGHEGQLRDGGEPYFEHPKRTALILMDELKIFEPKMLITALLHDIKEDSSILEWNDIELIFGKRIKEMVEILTKDNSLEKEQRDKEYLEKIQNADKTTKIIKLADRLDNLRTLQVCSEVKQKHIIQETREHYLEIAKETSGYLFEEMKRIIENSSFEKSKSQKTLH